MKLPDFKCCRCESPRDLSAKFDHDFRFQRFLCKTCEDAARACRRCGQIAPVMVELRYEAMDFARLERARIERGEKEPRKVCMPCLAEMRVTVDTRSGRPEVVDREPNAPASVVQEAPLRMPARTKPPRKSAGSGVFGNVSGRAAK